ncbi:NADPH dehydrogenase NamA [Pedobacter deserti]|uniref:NADPH dehydrogenase NamA n=1 Tax=Pedobacter deserti TaxID=2817382 RepID=UPI00210912E2|nr:NADPH dehydrogenase NamA [Pedobacter sp. SYSU D00382]
MSKLLSPFSIRNTTFRNRIVVSPMCQYSGSDGFAGDWHLVHLGSRAVGGAGLVMQEATAVSPEGRITDADLGIWKDEHIEKLRQIVDFVHSQGSKIGVQLAHAGRKASCEVPWKGGHQIAAREPRGWTTYGPSALPFKEPDEAPAELDEVGIAKVIGDFVEATKRAKQIGYDVIEIHAAHGYLLHQFYSPLSNQRNDSYGGSFENRVRLVLEVIDAVKQAWGSDCPLFLRVSATDWSAGGWTIDDSVSLSKLLKTKGVDLVDTSSGGNVPKADIPNTPGYQVDFARQIRLEAGISTGAVGLITTPQQAEEILDNESADLIFIARESLRDPYFPSRANRELGGDLDWPVQYGRAR